MNRKIHFILNYIKSKKKSFLMVLVCSAIFAFTFWMYGITVAAVLYPALVCMVIMAAAFAIMACSEYGKWKNMQEILQRAVGDDSEFVKILDTAEIRKQVNTTDEIENELLEIIERLKNGGMRLNDSMNMKYSDMVDYYTMWVHQIKTPIASMHLILQKEDSEDSRRLRAELFRVEQYVQMVLCFLRLDSDFTDYVIKEYRVDDIIRPAVRRLAPQFIMKKLSLEYEQTDEVALTDEKWLGFVVEQVLSNAVKYTSEGSISIKCDGDRLVISDTGIGIAAEDLPRIFDKGYTGFNGRADRKASGIGLYLCRRICDNLGHSIKVESAAGQGTTITIGLRRNKLEVE
jgi:signal transduction histidine kinase